MALHRLHSAFVLGYHGCDEEIAEKLLSGTAFRLSENRYDWLGHGIYFWEANPKRGLDYATQLAKRGSKPRIKTPTVIGAVIDLGLCLDLTTLTGIEQVKRAHDALSALSERDGTQLPRNHPDLLRRYLDCLVIQTVHTIRQDDKQPPLDSVKGIFTEGKPLYKGSGFYEKTHIQICVRNPECIKGVFRVPEQFLT